MSATPPRLTLLTVPAKQGYIWFRQGIWLFRKNPFAFLVVLFMYLLIVQMAVIVPFIGVLAVLLASPGLMLGFISAGRKTIKGERVGALTLFDGFRGLEQATFKRLLQLGGWYGVLIILLSIMLSLVVDFREILPVLMGEPTQKIEIQQQLYRAMAVAAVLYTPIAMLMWFAPMLVAWHNMPPHKAVFFSWLACWRNLSAFATYAVIWIALLVVVPFSLESIMDSMGMKEHVAILVMPYSMGLLAVMYCSFYATWRGCFGVISEEPELTV